LSVDLTGTLDGREFLELVSDGLGLSTGDRIPASRLALAGALHDESTDGRPWILVVENAQNASEQVWTEIDSLVHGLGTASGFASMIFVGPTELARLLASRSRRTLASRLCAHIHLLSWDLDECREFVESELGVGAMDRATLEELHRGASGSPRRVAQFVRRRWGGLPPRSPKQTLPASEDAPELASKQRLTTSQPMIVDHSANLGTAKPSAAIENQQPLSEPVLAAPLVPSRPPLRVEDGLIEVGWGGSLEADPVVESEPEQSRTLVATAGSDDESPAEELIEDHYAALQAWGEWAKNRGRGAQPDVPPRSSQSADFPPVGTTSEPDAAPCDPRRSSGIRAESQHEHAPYSQLFSRLRQSK
jgi:general secretion pathway protein A